VAAEAGPWLLVARVALVMPVERPGELRPAVDVAVAVVAAL